MTKKDEQTGLGSRGRFAPPLVTPFRGSSKVVQNEVEPIADSPLLRYIQKRKRKRKDVAAIERQIRRHKALAREKQGSIQKLHSAIEVVRSEVRALQLSQAKISAVIGIDAFEISEGVSSEDLEWAAEKVRSTTAAHRTSAVRDQMRKETSEQAMERAAKAERQIDARIAEGLAKVRRTP